MSKSSVLIFNGGSVGEGGSCNVHNLQLGVMTVNLPDFHTSRMYVLLDRSVPIESDPGYAPVDRYTMAEWIHRGDVIQVDCANLTSETDTSYAGALQSTTAVNQQGHVYTSTCTIRLDIKSNNHTESRYYRLEAVHDILTDIWYLGQDVNEVTTIINEDASNKVQNLDNNSGHYPSCPAVKEAIETAVSSVYHAAGPKTVAQLTSALLVAANQGDVYNITDSGTTTADFVEGAGHPIAAGDNVAICDVGDGVYKFDLLSGFVDLSGYLAANGDGSDVTASFTAASTRTNVVTGEKLSALFGKVAKWFGDLKALAFKDKVDTTDLEDDAVTADKVKDNETLPVNISGYANHLRQAKCKFLDNETGYRLMAELPPSTSDYADTCYIFNIYETRDQAELTSGILKGVLSIRIRRDRTLYRYSSAYKGSSIDYINLDLRVDPSTHGIKLYAAKSSTYFVFTVFELLTCYDQYNSSLNPTLYTENELLGSVSGTAVTPTFTLLKGSGGTIPLANNSGVGSLLEPVYVSDGGAVLKCENRIHDLTLQIKYIKVIGSIVGRKILCDRQSWTGTADNPEFAPVDPYTLAEWINRGDVIQVDFTLYDWWGDKFPGLIVEAQCSTLSGETHLICTNLRVFREKIVNNQPTVDFAWSNLITDEDTNTKYMEFQSI